MLIYKYYLQQENKMGTVKEGDRFKKKEVTSKIKFPEMNLRTRTGGWESTGDFEEAVLVKGKDRKPNRQGLRSEQVKRQWRWGQTELSQGLNAKEKQR